MTYFLWDDGLQDLSGRPYLGYDLEIPTQRVGNYDTQVSFQVPCDSLEQEGLIGAGKGCKLRVYFQHIVLVYVDLSQYIQLVKISCF